MTVEFEDLSPEQRTVRILAMGHPLALRRLQHIQHRQRFAEINDWSRIILQPPSRQNPALPEMSQQAMTMLIKLLS